MLKFIETIKVNNNVLCNDNTNMKNEYVGATNGKMNPESECLCCVIGTSAISILWSYKHKLIEENGIKTI